MSTWRYTPRITPMAPLHPEPLRYPKPHHSLGRSPYDLLTVSTMDGPVGQEELAPYVSCWQGGRSVAVTCKQGACLRGH